MYVRTKNGRIIDTTKIVTGSKFMDFATNDESFRIIFKTEPLSKSENLEELCDGFYNDILGDGIFNFDDLYIYNNFDSFKDDWFGYRTYDDWRGNGYGFIKTSKGLIYVAKMDNEGKLVLI